jgi:DNA-binding Lrp family transcriptional regulator
MTPKASIPWEHLDKETAHLFATPPKGSFTFQQFAERYRLSEKVAKRQVLKLCQQGICKEIGRFGSYNARHFKLVKK